GWCGDVLIEVYVAVGRAGLEGDIETAVRVAVRVGSGFAGPVEEHGKSVGVSEVTVEVAIKFAGDFEADLDGRDDADGRIEVAHIAEAGGVAVGHEAVGGESVRFSGLRLKERRHHRSKERQQNRNFKPLHHYPKLHEYRSSQTCCGASQVFRPDEAPYHNPSHLCLRIHRTIDARAVASRVGELEPACA